MSELIRTSFTIEENLLNKLEEMIANSSYENRSEFIRDMIREYLVKDEWERNEEVLGTITLVYDHEKRELSNKLTGLQHRHHGMVLASTHIHLDSNMCAEMIMLKGPAKEIRDMLNQLRQQIGVIHATLQMSSTGKKLQSNAGGGVHHHH